jgi:hypothetical protein
MHFDIGSFLAILPFLLAGLRYLRNMDKRGERMEVLMKEYPPHRHVGDRVVYPADYEPSLVERQRA